MSKRVTEFTRQLKSNIEGEDILLLVDTNDTTGSANGTTKRVTVGDVEGYIDATRIDWSNVPTVDTRIPGAIWNDSGTLKIS